MKLRTMMVAGFLSFGLLGGLAANALEKEPGHGKPGPGMSQEQREAMREACKDDKSKCQQMRKEHHEKEMQKRCADKPEKCAEMKARRAEMQKLCETDPKACEAKKAEMRAKMKERRGERQDKRINDAPKL